MAATCIDLDYQNASNILFPPVSPPRAHLTRWRTVALGSLLGVKDFNERNNRYVPSLSSFGSCDIQLVPKMYDTGSNARGSIIAYRAARQDAVNNGYELHGILGAARSDASKVRPKRISLHISCV